MQADLNAEDAPEVDLGTHVNTSAMSCRLDRIHTFSGFPFSSIQAISVDYPGTREP